MKLFSANVTPEHIKHIHVGKEITITVGSGTINVRVKSINGNSVMYETSDIEWELISPYFEPVKKSFSITGGE